MDGKTTRSENKILQIPVKRGMRQGTKVTFAKEGDEGPGIVPGMLFFHLSPTLISPSLPLPLPASL